MFNNIKYVWNSFRDFIKNPKTDYNIKVKQCGHLKTFFYLLLIDVVFIFFFSLLLKGLDFANITSLSQNKLNLLFKNLPPFVSLLMLVLIIPLVEELVFRLHLRLYRKHLHFNIIILIAGVIILLASFVKLIFLRISILSVGVILVALYFLNKTKLDKKIFNIWDMKFGYVFYISLLIFGMMHITNYDNGYLKYFLLPLLVLPQLLLGLFCGYIRISMDFFRGYLFHASHNFVSILPALAFTIISMSGGGFVEISEHNSLKKMNYSKIQNDTIIFDRLSVYDIMPRLLNSEKKDFNDYLFSGKYDLIEYEDTAIANKILYIKYVRENDQSKGLLKSSKSIVLNELLKKYNLKITKKSIEKSKYYLQITDTGKLRLHVEFDEDTLIRNKYPIWFNDSIILKNVDLNFIARTINMNYDQEIVDTLKDNNRYTMMIPKLEFEVMNEFITKHYGIKLDKSYYKVPGFRISTVK